MKRREEKKGEMQKLKQEKGTNMIGNLKLNIKKCIQSGVE
jgi:hypothetical protein